MADDGTNLVIETDTASQTDPAKDEIVLSAREQVQAVMSSAMNIMNKETELAQAAGPSPSGPSGQGGDQEQQMEYVEPMQDPYSKAIKYLENHNVLQLFQQLTASIVYTKPEKPLEFMMNEVERMKQEKEQEKEQERIAKEERKAKEAAKK